MMTTSPQSEKNIVDRLRRRTVLPANSNRSPLRLLLVLALLIFVSECVVMLFLAYLPPLSVWSGALLDGSLMLVLISPTLYLLVFRPLIELIAERRRAEESLELGVCPNNQISVRFFDHFSLS